MVILTTFNAMIWKSPATACAFPRSMFQNQYNSLEGPLKISATTETWLLEKCQVKIFAMHNHISITVLSIRLGKNNTLKESLLQRRKALQYLSVDNFLWATTVAL